MTASADEHPKGTATAQQNDRVVAEIVFPYGTAFVAVDQVPGLIADALHPIPANQPDAVADSSVADAALLRRALAEETYEKRLREAIYKGELVTRDSVTGFPLPAVPMSSAVVSSEDFAEYIKPLGIVIGFDFICISDLLPPLASALVDAHPGSWQKEGHNNDIRRDVAWAMVQVRLQQLVKDVVDKLVIVPLNGWPAHGELLCDVTWGVNRKDAERLREFLRVSGLSNSLWDEINLAADEKEARQTQLRAQDEAKRMAGRYTILEALIELARATGLSPSRWREVILGDIRKGALPLRNPADYADRLPYEVPLQIQPYYDQVDAESLNKWLDEHPQWPVPYRFPVDAATNEKDTKRLTKRPQSMREQQGQQILQTIRDLGHDPKALPKEAGKAGVKAQVRKRVALTKDSFDHTWKWLRKSGEIV